MKTLLAVVIAVALLFGYACYRTVANVNALSRDAKALHNRVAEIEQALKE